MRVYKSKEELKAEINKTFEKYISEFDSIPEALKDKRVDEVDRTPAENLAYQVGWTTLVLKWEEDERVGKHEENSIEKNEDRIALDSWNADIFQRKLGIGVILK